jgi:hypothetical protein
VEGDIFEAADCDYLYDSLMSAKDPGRGAFKDYREVMRCAEEV